MRRSVVGREMMRINYKRPQENPQCDGVQMVTSYGWNIATCSVLILNVRIKNFIERGLSKIGETKTTYYTLLMF